ncbi:MAG: FAD-binding oxidoreductase [Leptospiraceae bacterium]|nr:FAD-binding oxidoreductase [Leptospiraceae bacterium]
MLYTELNSKINYDRKNLRWDAWGASDQDFFLKNYISDIIQLIKDEWGVSYLPDTPGIDWKDIQIKSPRFTAEQTKSLIKIVGEDRFLTDNYERIFHSVGRSYYDVMRLRFNQLKEFTDGVIYPGSNVEVSNILKFCRDKNIAVVPFGGGSSVVGGVEALKLKTQKAILTIDLSKMNSLIDIDEMSCTATFQAGIYGPQLEKILSEKGYTLGHFPQSFEYSTLGGWIAARSSGQQSGKYGKIEKILVSLRMVTPEGDLVTPRLPPYSMGPDMNQIIAGSEGLLGVITEVTVKIHPTPPARKYFAFVFPEFSNGVNFIRTANREGLRMSMMRLSDEDETFLFSHFGSLGKPDTIFRKFKNGLKEKVLSWNGIFERRCALIGGIDSNPMQIGRTLDLAKKIAGQNKGFFGGTSPGKNWLKSRYNMPFLRNHFMERGIGVDTLETSITYDRLLKLHEDVTVAIRKVFPVCNTMCHVSHSYPEGASLYFTIIFPMNVKDPVSQWKSMKSAASEAILKVGGSISHHHGVGVDHKDWYQRIMGEKSIEGLTAIKKTWDKKGILNPGKLFS